MKIQDIDRRTRGWGGASRLAVAAGVLLITALFGPIQSAVAQGLSGGGDSDSVGSLPMSKEYPSSTTPTLNPDGNGDFQDHFRMRMIGPEREIRALVIDARGNGKVLRKELGTHGTVRYTFVGDVQVLLDRARLARSFVTVEMAIGPVFTGGRAVVHAGERRAAQLLHAGAFDLHLRQLAASGLTDVGVELQAWSREHGVARLTAKTRGDLIVLDQDPKHVVTAR